MLSTMRKVGFLSLALGIALVGFLAFCHAMNKSEAMMASGAEHKPFSFAIVSSDASQECCLLASHDIHASFLAATAERNNGWYSVGAVLALFALWRFKNKDLDGGRAPMHREVSGFVFRFLQEAFARGIIQPRIFEPAVV